MDLTTPYLGFVMAAYAIFAIVLLGLLAAIVLRGHSLKRNLQELGLSDPGARSKSGEDAQP